MFNDGLMMIVDVQLCLMVFIGIHWYVMMLFDVYCFFLKKWLLMLNDV